MICKAFRALIVFIPFLLVCTDLENPYASVEDARLSIQDKTFAANEVSVFSTETLTVAALLREHLQQATVRIPGNRLWQTPDSVISGSSLDGKPMQFSFSFTDTGDHSIELYALRNDNAVAAETLLVHAGSPLRQTAIQTFVGDTVTLSTPPVKDPVLYVWEYKPAIQVRSLSPTFKAPVTESFVSGLGKLWVESPEAQSPAVFFQVTAVDKQPPKLTSLDADTDSDTIVAAQSAGFIRFLLEDESSITNVAFNGEQAADLSPAEGGAIAVYTFNDLREDMPTPLTLSAEDRNGNQSQRTWRLVYRPGAGPHGSLLQVKLPAADTSISHRAAARVAGAILKSAGAYETYRICIEVNGARSPNCKLIANDFDIWMWNVELTSDTNIVRVRAFGGSTADGPEVGSATRTIIYQPSAQYVDSAAPIIQSLAFNSAPLTDSMIVPVQTGRLEAWVIDDNSIASVTINGADITPSGIDNRYNGAITLNHSAEGTLVEISAADSAGNVSTVQRRVFANRAPQFTEKPESTVVITAGETHASQVIAVDPDNDPINYVVGLFQSKTLIELLESGPDGSFSWTAGQADTGSYIISVQADDGWETVSYTYELFVKSPTSTYVPVRFGNSLAEFPDTLIADSQSLDVGLRVQPGTGAEPFRFTAHIPLTNLRLLDNSQENHVFWQPTLTDTGLQQFELLVKDQAGQADTLEPAIRVIRTPKKVRVFFDQSYSQAPEDVASHSILVRLLSKAADTITATLSVDNEESTLPPAAYSFPHGLKLVFEPGETSKELTIAVVDNDSVQTDRVLTLRLAAVSPNAQIGLPGNDVHAHTVVEDDKPPASTWIGFDADSSDTSALESADSARFGVRLSNATSIQVAADYSLVTQKTTGEQGQDFAFSAGTVVFDSGVTYRSFGARIIQDQIMESREQITVRLHNFRPSPYANAGSTVEYSIFLDDDDTPDIQIERNGRHIPADSGSFDFGTKLLAESETVTFTIANHGLGPLRLSGPVELTGDDEFALTRQPSVNEINAGQSAEFSVTFSSSAEGSFAGAASLPSNDPDESPYSFEIRANASINLTPAIAVAASSDLESGNTFTFDSIPQNIDDTVEFSIENRGNATLQLTGSPPVAIDHDKLANFTVLQQPPASIEPGQSVSFRVRHESNPVGNARSRMVIATNDEKADPFTVTLSGVSYLLPILSFARGSTELTPRKDIDFDTTERGKADTMTLRVFNPADPRRAPLKLYKMPNPIQLENNGIITVGSQPTSPIPQGESRTFTLIFRPVSIGSFEETVRIWSNDRHGLRNPFKIYLHAVSVAPSWQVYTAVEGRGTVTLSPEGGVYKEGTPITVQAQAFAGWHFDHWKNTSNAVNPRQVTIDTAMVITAVFLPDSPVISVNPQPTTVTEGDPVTFSVQAAGADLHYQWRRNTEPIDGETGADYTISAASMSDSGATFDVIVSNAGGSASSGSALLRVKRRIVAPSIGADQPADVVVTEGENATFSISVSGTNPLIRWFVNDAEQAGQHDLSLTVPSVTASMNNTKVYAIASNDSGTATSRTAVLTVSPDIIPPAIAAGGHPHDTAVVESTAATFSVIASGTSLRYQWRIGGTPADGATQSIFSLANAHAGYDQASIDVVVSNSQGSVTSEPAVLTVWRKPTIQTQPRDRSVATGDTVTYLVTAAGTEPFSYRWFRDGAPIANATRSSYAIEGVTVSDSGAGISVRIYNIADSVTSRRAMLRVSDPVAIAASPADDTLRADHGDQAIFRARATGSPPISYQWQKNGFDIDGAQADSLVITSGANGDRYRMIATNGDNAYADTSGEAILTVITAPSIAVQPASDTVNQGQNAAFTVEADGTAPLTYQWYTDTGAIADANGKTLTIISAEESQDQSGYWVEIANSAGSEESYQATLTVMVPPVITADPESQKVYDGSTISLGVGVEDGNYLRYQWRKDGVDIPEATGDHYQTTVYLADSGSEYSVYVYNQAGNATSAGAIVHVLPIKQPPNVIDDPDSVTVNEGGSATFRVSVTGTPPFTFSWKRFDGVTTHDAATASDTFWTATNAPLSWDGNEIFVIVTNDTGADTSANAQITVEAAATPVAITTNPSSETVPEGSSASFTVAVTGTPPIDYAWFINGVEGRNVIGSSALSDTWTITQDWSPDPYEISVTVSNGNGAFSAQSVPVQLIVNREPPVFTAQPSGDTLAAGGNFILSVSASGAGALSYEWRRNGVTIDGETGASYEVSGAQPGIHSGDYQAVVTNEGGSTTSETVSVLVYDPLTIAVSPTSYTAHDNELVTFTATDAGGVGSRSIEWRDQGDNILGSGVELSFTAQYPSHDGLTVRAIVSDEIGGSAEASALVSVENATIPVAISTNPTGSTVPEGSEVTFTVEVTGTAPFDYLWYKDGVEERRVTASSSTSDSWAFAATYSATPYQISVMARNGDGLYSAQSEPVHLTVTRDAPVIDQQPESDTVAVGQSFSLSVLASGNGALSYQWYRNGSSISGATEATYSVDAAQITPDSGSYYVIVSNEGGPATSQTVPVLVHAPLAISVSPSSYTAYHGETVTFTATASGGIGDRSIAWRDQNSNPFIGDEQCTFTAEYPAHAAMTVYATATDEKNASQQAAATLTVPPPLVIGALDDPVIADHGRDTTLTAIVSGGTPPYSIDWKIREGGGAVKSIGTGSSISWTPHYQSEDGGALWIEITDDLGATGMSNEATLDIDGPGPMILEQPQSQTVEEGASASFSALVEELAPVTYAWFRNDTLISESNASLYSITATTPDMSGNKYHAEISDYTGTAISAAATLYVNPTAVAHY